jgi:hypothetical protein
VKAVHRKEVRDRGLEFRRRQGEEITEGLESGTLCLRLAPSPFQLADPPSLVLLTANDPVGRVSTASEDGRTSIG